MIGKVSKVIIRLHASVLSPGGAWTGRAVPAGSLKPDGVTATAVSRRTCPNRVTPGAGYIMPGDAVPERIPEGKHADFGLSHCGLPVGELSEGDRPARDGAPHSLHPVSATAGDVRRALKSADGEICGGANTGMTVNTLPDRVAGKICPRTAPGGDGVIPDGFKMRIEGGEAADAGLFPTAGTGQATRIPKTSILNGNPVPVSFTVPANLPAGNCRRIIVSRFSPGGALLKEPGTYVSDHVPVCRTDEAEAGNRKPEVMNHELSAG